MRKALKLKNNVMKNEFLNFYNNEITMLDARAMKGGNETCTSSEADDFILEDLVDL